ncbi:MAG: hypothetical protein GXO25_01875 [Euryarchaeota archaeon]|nr:hypothetical protein [Euryarchaeota archaeon]
MQDYLAWLFDSPLTWLPEETEQWWEDVYHPLPMHTLLAQREQWCVVTGPPQSGKSTALAYLERQAEERRAFVLRDDVFFQDKWKTLLPNHLTRILTLFFRQARRYFRENPESLGDLSTTQKEFLRWGIEKFLGRRSLLRWADALPSAWAKEVTGLLFEDIYPSLDGFVEGPIEEMITLAKRMGYEQILVLVDTPPFLLPQHQTEIKNLLSWLAPMQFRALKVVVAVPLLWPPQQCEPVCCAGGQCKIERDILRWMRGRGALFKINVSEDMTRAIVRRYLHVATRGEIASLDMLCAPALEKGLHEWVVAEFGAPVPGAWVKLTAILLERSSLLDKPRLTLADKERVLARFYALHMPLQLGRGDDGEEQGRLRGVWRGHRWIPLDISQYEVLARLFRAQGTPLAHDAFAMSKGNLHTTISRLRKKIEPLRGISIYLHNKRSEGYWLEHQK